MPSVKSLVLTALSASAAVSAAVLRRDVETIASDLKTINTDLNELTAAVNEYNGGLVAAIPVTSAEGKLTSDIASASENAASSEVLNSADSTSLINYINNTLEPNIVKILEAMVSKQAAFESSNLGNKAQGDINTLREATNDLGESYLGIAAEDTKADGQAALTKIDGNFNEAVKAYAGSETAAAAPAASSGANVKVASSAW